LVLLNSGHKWSNCSVYYSFLKVTFSHEIYLFVILLCSIAVLDRLTIKKYLLAILLLFLIPLLYILVFHTEQFYYLSMNLLLMLLFFKFCYDLISELQMNHSVDIFQIVPIFYIFSLLTKVDSVITGFSNNYYYYHITNILDILIGLFFVIFRYGNPKHILQLK